MPNIKFKVLMHDNFGLDACIIFITWLFYANNLKKILKVHVAEFITF